MLSADLTPVISVNAFSSYYLFNSTNE